MNPLLPFSSLSDDEKYFGAELRDWYLSNSEIVHVSSRAGSAIRPRYSLPQIETARAALSVPTGSTKTFEKSKFLSGEQFSHRLSYMNPLPQTAPLDQTAASFGGNRLRNFLCEN